MQLQGAGHCAAEARRRVAREEECVRRGSVSGRGPSCVQVKQARAQMAIVLDDSDSQCSITYTHEPSGSLPGMKQIIGALAFSSYFFFVM